MTGKEFLLQLNNHPINMDAIKEIEAKYRLHMPLLIQKIISISQESLFFDNTWRTLSFKEILDAPEDLHVDFVELKILPLFDTGDNDFIVYRFDDHVWSKFNIIDECFFKNKNLLEDYF